LITIIFYNKLIKSTYKLMLKFSIEDWEFNRKIILKNIGI